MATARMLSTTIAIDAQLAQLSQTAEWMYLKCIPHLDRDGMITGEPMGLLGIVSPMRFSEVHAVMPALIDEWVQVGLVLRFAAAVGPVLFFKGFLKQQSLKYSRERPSQFPCPPGYIRTVDGLMAASDVPWVEVEAEPIPAVFPVSPGDSGKSATFAGVLAKNPDSAPQQQQQQQQQQQREQEQQQQQQQQQDEPAAAAAAALVEFGITGKVLAELAECPEADVRGWIAYAGTQERLSNPRGYVIKRLRSGEPPPALPDLPAAAEEDTDSFEALKRRYVPKDWEDVIKH